ncbi:MAG: peptidase M48 [Desulfuromonas sp.]|nr:MAG: peptidase M48 [Desulfuromonas sp.]
MIVASNSRILVSLCCFMLAVVSGCAVNPVTGQQELMLLSEPQERQMGGQTDQAVIEQYGLYPDTPLNSYIEGLGQPMARLSHRPELGWSFKVMDTPVVNAFAAPGGYIYVTRGLLAAVNDEAELAGVLGHEIGHVTARHSARKYSQMMLTNLGVGLGISLAGDYGELLGPLLQAGTGLLFLKFSRDDERQADALGVEYASKAGFDAGKLADFFTSLERMSSLDGGDGGRLPEFFSTHPNPVNRQASVREMAARWQAERPGQAVRVNRDGYLQRIDGMVYGDDPRQGFLEGDWFYLPELGVQFRVPADWNFAREGQQIQMASPDQKGLIFFEVKQGAEIAPLAASFVTDLKAELARSVNGTKAGMPSLQQVLVVTDQGKRAVIQSEYIQGQGKVLAFHGMTAEADFAKLQQSLTLPVDSFSAIRDQAKRNPQPRRIHVEQVRRPASLQTFLQSAKIEKTLWEKIAWMNGMSLGDQLSAGQRIKTVR